MASNTAATAPEQDVRRAEIFGPVAEDLDLCLWDCFAKTAASFPGRDAILSLWQSAGRPLNATVEPDLAGDNDTRQLRWSYDQLLHEASQVASVLEKLGCGPRSQLAAVLWNSAEWGLFFWAAAKVGMTFVPLDPRAMNDVGLTITDLKPHVLVAQDQHDAVALSPIAATLPKRTVCIQCSGPVVDGWRGLQDLSLNTQLQEQQQQQALELRQLENCNLQDQTDPALIVFTSGTTGKPKGCLHTTVNLMSQLCDYDPAEEGQIDRWLVHTPTSHIFAINNALRAWKLGGAVIFPSKSFDVGSTLDALLHAQCTIMSATPTLVKSLMAHPSFKLREKMHLNIVSIAGTMISRDDIELCRSGLGSNHAIQAYGMSEGAPLISWARTDELLQAGFHAGVGKVLAGAAIRICHPEGRDVLNKGMVGELHVAGSSVITGYHSQADTSAFYDDGSTRWFATGDQAMIDDDNVVHILGRYKDLIIRGGENIQPSQIERALSGIPGLQAHVVGIPDPLAGQIPVAVVNAPDALEGSTMAEKALSLGPSFALGGIYSLDDLGLEHLPTTSLGKVKKEVLKDAVLRYRNEQLQIGKDVNTAHERLVSLLIDFWEEVTAIRPQRDQNILYIADSITMLRFCDTVVRSCGKQVYIQDLVDHHTVEAQAILLASRDDDFEGTVVNVRQPSPTFTTTSSGPTTPSTPGSLTAASTLVLQSADEPDGKMRTEVARRALESIGMPVSELEDTIPIRTSHRRLAIGQRPQSYHISMTFRIRNVPNATIRDALNTIMRRHALLRAILCQTPTGCVFHAIPKHSFDLTERTVVNEDVQSINEAVNHAGKISAEAQSSLFMFKIVLLSCKEDGCQYLSLTFSHSIMDALSVILWNRDLDTLLHNPNARLPTLTPYKLFADLFDQYSESSLAKEAVSFHVKRLRGISLLKKALWPVQKAPGWMISSDAESVHAEERARVRNGVWEDRWDAVKEEWKDPRISRVVNLPHLKLLGQQHGVTPPNLAKAAITMLNVLQTGSSHAIFTTWESGRSWPFVPKWIEGVLPPPMSIDGPTLEWLLNMTEVDADETVMGFLQRVEAEHALMKRYEHAPWSHVMRELRDEGEAADSASFRQSFVWDVSLAMMVPKSYTADYKVLEPVNRHNWADCGLFWNAFMLDSQNLYFIASWDTAQMNDYEVQSHCDTLADMMRRLSSEKNWNRTIGEVFGTQSNR